MLLGYHAKWRGRLCPNSPASKGLNPIHPLEQTGLFDLTVVCFFVRYPLFQRVASRFYIWNGE